MTLPQTRERRPHEAGAASIKSFRGDVPSVPGNRPVAASAAVLSPLPWARALAQSPSAPTCRCGDYSRALAAVVPLVWADAYAQGHADGLAEGLAQGAAHPAVAASVARVFAGWDGADAARERSVASFTTWHSQARAQVKEGPAYDRLAA